jgi:hypothetical protein
MHVHHFFETGIPNGISALDTQAENYRVSTLHESGSCMAVWCSGKLPQIGV